MDTSDRSYKNQEKEMVYLSWISQKSFPVYTIMPVPAKGKNRYIERTAAKARVDPCCCCTKFHVFPCISGVSEADG